MNVTLFNNFWNFLHQFPYEFFDDELLSRKEAILVLRFCHQIPKIIPCIYCSDSAQFFEKQLKLFDSLTIKLPNGKRIISRAQILKFYYLFHNIVDKKLGKKLLQATWRDSVMQRPSWEECFWMMIYLVGWNFPEKDPTSDQIYNFIVFYRLIFAIVCNKNNPLGKRIKELLEYEYPLTENVFINRYTVKQWVWTFRKKCDEISGTIYEFKDFDTIMETYRAKHQDCKDGKEKTEAEKLAELHQALGCK